MDRLDRVLRGHETDCVRRLEAGLPIAALVRRAKYPDRTTALPLWGSVKYHGSPWIGHRSERLDQPDDLLETLAVPNTAPQVFLSHTYHDRDLALELAETLAALEIGAWRFETQIDQRGDIADCVREAVAEAACLVALVTRHSVASLWVLTELHTALTSGQRVALLVDTGDPLLVRLLQSVWFPHPDSEFDLAVEYDQSVAHQLDQDYARVESESRAHRYVDQLHSFLASLPYYLGSVDPGTGRRIWQPALAFRSLPAGSSRHVEFACLQEIVNRLPKTDSGTLHRAELGYVSSDPIETSSKPG